MLSVALLLLPRPTSSTERTIVTIDGAWWNGLTLTEKLSAVQGILVGYDAGYEEAAFVMAYAHVTPTETNHQFAAVQRFHDLVSVYSRTLQKNTASLDRSFGTMVQEIDDYFSNRRLIKRTW